MAAPDRKDRKRPLELVGLSAVLGGFAFLIVLMGTREPIVALQFAGVGFIASLVILAMLALAVKPADAEQADIAEQNRDEDDPRPPMPTGH